MVKHVLFVVSSSKPFYNASPSSFGPTSNLNYSLICTYKSLEILNNCIPSSGNLIPNTEKLLFNSINKSSFFRSKVIYDRIPNRRRKALYRSPNCREHSRQSSLNISCNSSDIRNYVTNADEELCNGNCILILFGIIHQALKSSIQRIPFLKMIENRSKTFAEFLNLTDRTGDSLLNSLKRTGKLSTYIRFLEIGHKRIPNLFKRIIFFKIGNYIRQSSPKGLEEIYYW